MLRPRCIIMKREKIAGSLFPSVIAGNRSSAIQTMYHGVQCVRQALGFSLSFNIWNAPAFVQRYINDLLKVCKTFFNYLESEGLIDSSPAKRIKNMKLPKLKLRTFTEKNIMDMINYYNGRSFIEIRNRAMIAMMFDTGVRLSELMELVETQIHEETIMIYGKGAKERVAPVSPFLSKALLRYSRARESFFHDALHDKEFFLSRTGKKLTAEAVAKMLKKAAKAVGVSEDIRVSPHTCRHTFAHLNLKNGLDLYTLSRLLGHENVSITQRYLEGITDEGVIRIARKSGVLENIR